MQKLNDQIGELDDSLAAAEYRNKGLEVDIKELEKEIRELKGSQLNGTMAMGDKEQQI